MSFYFFLSYANNNQDEEEVEKFFTDLGAELRRQIGEKRSDVEMGFIDREELKAGVDWERELFAALLASRTLVCLYSPAYFKSPWCGREWKVFHRRQELSVEKRKLGGVDNSSSPRAIKPITWIASEAPSAVRGIQSFTFDTPEDIYHRRGLFYLIHGHEKYEYEYNDFIFQLAKDIHKEAIRQHSLPLSALPPTQYPLLGQVEKAFGGEEGVLPTPFPDSYQKHQKEIKYPLPKPKPPLAVKTVVVSIFVCVLAVTLALISYRKMNGSKPPIESNTKMDTDAAVFISPSAGWKIWAPTKDSGWQRGNVDEVCPIPGRRIRGETIGLFKTANSTGDFNWFRDFIFHINVRFINGKGAAWVVRAKDFNNYYLFELTTSKSQNGKKQIKFYICLNGTLKEVEPVDVVDEIDENCKQFDIYTLAKGSEFRVFLRPFKPITGPLDTPIYKPVILGVFQDNSITEGGVGFYPRQGMDIQLHQLLVMPLGTKESEETARSFPNE